jgi:pimeloyl-ACP methyl ester carboxylesterase
MPAGDGGALPALHDTGEGPALLFLHAFPLDASQWDHQVAVAGRNHRCLRVDMWGCGSSPQPDGPPSLELFAAATLRALDERGVDAFVLCGASMGGYVAWELLRLAPQRVQALVLTATRPSADSDEGRATREQTAVTVLEHGVETIVEDNVTRLLGRRGQHDVHIADPLRARVRRWTPAGIAWALRAMAARRDSTGLLSTIAVPALVVAGAEDAVIGSTDQRRMADVIPGARFVEVAGCGHLVNLEDPPGFNAELDNFLSGALPG